jgi:Kelch motif/Galactose oxidase, central domain
MLQQPLKDKTTKDEASTVSTVSSLIQCEVPSDRTHFSLTRDPVTGELIMFGGKLADGSYCSDTYRWNTCNDQWSCSKPTAVAPPSRAGHRGVVHSGHMYIFGGETSTGQLSDLWKLNLTSHLWSEVSQANRIKPCSGYKWAAGKQYIAKYGGYHKIPGRETQYFNDTWLFHILERRWELCTYRRMMGIAEDGSSYNSLKLIRSPFCRSLFWPPTVSHTTAFVIDPQTERFYFYPPYPLWDCATSGDNFCYQFDELRRYRGHMRFDIITPHKPHHYCNLTSRVSDTGLPCLAFRHSYPPYHYMVQISPIVKSHLSEPGPIMKSHRRAKGGARSDALKDLADDLEDGSCQI